MDGMFFAVLAMYMSKSYNSNAKLVRGGISFSTPGGTSPYDFNVTKYVYTCTYMSYHKQ